MNALANIEHTTSIPRWHFTMLRDEARNYAIESCISNLSLEGKTVVEIGAGAGLPAMLFAKYGAHKVVTLEMNPNIATIARSVIRANGFDNCIDVIAKPSWEAIDDGDIPSNPDVIFTETLDCGVVGEGYEAVARDIRRLAGPNTIVLPQSVQQFGFLSCDDAAYEKNTVFTQCGFDLSSLNELAAQTYYPINQLLHSPVALSATILLRAYDYKNEKCLQPVRRTIVASNDGTCHGITSHFQAWFGNFLISSEHPTSHWAMAFHPLVTPVKIEKGQCYYIEISGTGQVAVTETSRCG